MLFLPSQSNQNCSWYEHYKKYIIRLDADTKYPIINVLNVMFGYQN